MIKDLRPGRRCLAKVPFAGGTLKVPVTVLAVREDGTCTVREKFSRRHGKTHEGVPAERLSAHPRGPRRRG